MVQIGSIKSIGHATDYSYNLDDRQELVKTVGGAVAVDPWGGTRISDGDIVSFSAIFTSSDASTVQGYWSNRTRQNVTLDDGTTITNGRIIVRQITLLEGFWSGYKKLGLEVWKV